MCTINTSEYAEKVAEIKRAAAARAKNLKDSINARQEILRRELEYYGDSSGLKVDALTGEVDFFGEVWDV